MNTLVNLHSLGIADSMIVCPTPLSTGKRRTPCQREARLDSSDDSMPLDCGGGGGGGGKKARIVADARWPAFLAARGLQADSESELSESDDDCLLVPENPEDQPCAVCISHPYVSVSSCLQGHSYALPATDCVA